MRPVLTPQQITVRSSQIDVHDDTIERLAVLPAAKRGGQAAVEMTLFRPGIGRRRMLRFSGCANISVVMDINKRGQMSQFSTRSDLTRENSRSLSVTRVQPSARAWAAIRRSLGPIGRPLRSRSARSSP